MKLVSTKTRYGGPRAVLCLKNSADGTLGLQCHYKKHSRKQGLEEQQRKKDRKICRGWFEKVGIAYTFRGSFSLSRSFLLGFRTSSLYLQKGVNGGKISFFYGKGYRVVAEKKREDEKHKLSESLGAHELLHNCEFGGFLRLPHCQRWLWMQ